MKESEQNGGGGGTATTTQQQQALEDGSGPSFRLMKTQLNFFMTRLLFMQEDKADSLGARQTNARRMNNSLNGSMNNSSGLGNSASRVGSDVVEKPPRNDDGLLGYFDVGEEPTDDICVFSDNARIIPNNKAKSMPPIPFPPAAPESPRRIEGRQGLIYKTPSHLQLATADDAASLISMPELNDFGLSNHTENSSYHTQQFRSDGEDTETEEAEEYEEMAMDIAEEQEDGTNQDMKPAAVARARAATPSPPPPPPARRRRSSSAGRRAGTTPYIPPEQRVFPKNQRRSKRVSASNSFNSATRPNQKSSSDEESS